MQGWTWIALWLVLPTIAAIALSHPWLIGLVLVGFVMQRWLPDPLRWLRGRRRARALELAVEVNAENMQARRDLAMLWIERGAPKRALRLCEEAQRREPDSAEVAYLHGIALLRTGKPDLAIEKLDFAVRRDPKLRYGDPFLKAGEAYLALGRVEEANTVLEKFTAMNGSSLEGWLRLSRARAAKGDAEGARKARDEARRTFRQLPGFQRRKQWTWWLRSLV